MINNEDQSRAGTPRQDSRYQANPDAVYNRLGDSAVVVNMRTNRIYELNRTGARFWELLCAGHDLEKLQQLMLQEFDVTESELAIEIEAMLASLQKEGLIEEAS